NNLGVMLARVGRLSEAEREFATALRKADGSFAEAAHNLELCRKLRAGHAKDGVAQLKVAAIDKAFNR
ncbi:MAG TPA: hypothetical protein VGV59_14395, partial [Pyrinomonadaceae bacterium]|nr:hypothetical protein [Pyrinomonadaceae bacterium]